MSVTMIRKLNTIISLWLIAIIITLVIFAYQLNVVGLYIAAGVFGALLLASNIFTIVNSAVTSYRSNVERETEYKKF